MRIFYQLLSTMIVMTIALAIGEGDLNIQSVKREEEALLKFKEGFKNPSNQLSSWDTRRDFCTWAGVECTNNTGHVISLDLHSTNPLDKLQGELSSSLLELPYLSSLNLSGNDFMQSKLPAFLGSMKNLKHLNLSGANFKGNLPQNLGNLSLLESLDLSHNDLFLEGNLLKWLHGLSSLKILDLSRVALSSSADDWFGAISRIPSLVMLRLSCCQLHQLPPSPPEVKFDSLVTLDLSLNHFSNTIPDWLFENCPNLQHLNLSNTQLQGPIPDSIGRLTSLVALDLSNNDLSGSIPSTLGQAHGQNKAGPHLFLKELRLSNNKLNGSMERSLGQLSKLVVLDLAHNNLEANITDAHLANFTSLMVLDLSFNRVAFNVSKNWVPPFQLETIGLGTCQLGPEFPKWIQTQKNFSHIDISNAGVSDSVPEWFWDLSPSVEYMNLSSNELRGCPSKLKLQMLDLSNNSFSCPLPHLPSNMRVLNLAENSFYGDISPVCEMLGVDNSLSFLDLSSNNFSGNVPDCWTLGGKVVILNLAYNHFSGSIPDSIGGLTSLQTVSMNGNNLSGEIPEALKNCIGLELLDLGYNQLSGPIPSWIGEEMQHLRALVLSRNSFEGPIPTVFCQLKSLMVLDLSKNQLTGAIPRCVFPAMTTQDAERSYIYDPYIAYTDHLLLTMKGRNIIFSRILILLRILDLSSNYLTESIPVEITKHIALEALNLSRNQLVGSIPSDIGQMKNMGALDLSWNKLSCTIPTSMVDLLFLAVLNLSYNNLSGGIPQENQFMTFDSSSYDGNPNLCGAPLPLEKACSRNESRNESYEEPDPACRKNDEVQKKEHEHGNRDGPQVLPFYLGGVVGYITGFWAFWVSLCCSTSWRHAYFRFLGHMNDKVYVMVAISLARLRRKFGSQQ